MEVDKRPECTNTAETKEKVRVIEIEPAPKRDSDRSKFEVISKDPAEIKRILRL